jgi:rhamnosyl/mannosyltransferase
VDAIPIGIPLPQRAIPPVRDAWKQRYGHLQPFVLGVGRLIYYKGFEVLIEAAARASWSVVILGRGPLEQSLRALAAQRGCSDRVTFITEHVTDEDLAIWFEECRVFAFPSVFRSEAFGIVQIEAMAVGKPVVNTHLPTGVP